MNKKRITLSLALLPVVSALYGQKAQTDKPDSRPNIIFIMSDDHARQAMSIYGHPIGKLHRRQTSTASATKALRSTTTTAATPSPDRVAQQYSPANTATKTGL